MSHQIPATEIEEAYQAVATRYPQMSKADIIDRAADRWEMRHSAAGLNHFATVRQFKAHLLG